MAGDRRATMGNLIAQRDIEKVFPADAYSVVGFAGTAGIGIEMIRLFQLELEHYEKIEGTQLTLDGKANRLASMIRGNLAVAMQGLAVLPLFAGFDLDAADPARAGRIFSYDVTGGPYEERDFAGIGSGSLFARGALKKMWRPGMSRDEVVRVVVEALYDAADDDSATGGPDMARRIFPVVDAGHRRGHRPGAGGPGRRDVRGGHRRARGQPGQLRERRDEHAVLRLGRADHAGPLGVRAQEHRPRPPGGRDRRTPTGSCSSPRTRPRRCTRSARSTTGSGSPRSAATASTRRSGWPGSGSPTSVATPTTGAT